MFVVAGSIPERGGNKIYNTCTVWNPQGQLVAKHRKVDIFYGDLICYSSGLLSLGYALQVHLFNVDLPGKIRFQESEALTAGSTFNTFDTENFKIGLGICHDTRFPEMANYYQEQGMYNICEFYDREIFRFVCFKRCSAFVGCKLVIYPGAFCDHLGPPHWKLLLQSRAIDNQFYVAGVACARNENAGYKSYGHSMFVNPFGEVEAATEYAEDIIYGFVGEYLCVRRKRYAVLVLSLLSWFDFCFLDLDKVEEFRTTVPILKQKRTDMYEVQYNYKQK